MILLPAGGGAVLLLLLGFCLRRRLHGRARKQIARDVNGDPEAETSAQDATDSAEAGAEPRPELVADSRPVARDGFVDLPLRPIPRPPFKQDRVKGSLMTPRVLWPIRLPHAGMLSGRGMLSPAAAKEVTDARDRARGSPAAPNAGPEPEPATVSCGARASDGGESGQADRSANGKLARSARWHSGQPAVANLQRPVSTDVLHPSTLPAPPDHRITVRGDGQGKLTEAVEVAPMTKAARSCRSRASIKATEAELDDMFAGGAKGTKDGPGRSTSRGPVRPPLHRPTPRKGAPDDLFASVRARTAALQAAASLERSGSSGDTKRLTGIQEMRRERTRRRISKENWQRSERSRRGLEGLSSGEGPIVRV